METEIEVESPEIIIPKKNVIMDSQVLSTLMSCTRLFDFRFNHNLVPLSGRGPSIEKGSLTHVMLETFYKNYHDKKNRIDLALAAADKYSTSSEISSLSTDDKELVRNTFLEYCEYYKNDHWIPIDVEFVKGDIVYEDDEIRVIWKAKLDLTVDTNQGIYPVDHKTSSYRKDAISLNNQFMGQCFLMKTHDIVINKIGFQKTLKVNEKFARQLIHYTTDNLAEWTEIVGYYAKYLVALQETGYYPPNFAHCDKWSGCIFMGVCKSDRGMRDEELKLNFKIGDRWDISVDD